MPGPPSARFLGVDGFPWDIDKPVCDMLWRAILVSGNGAFMGFLGVHSHEDGLPGCFLQVEDGETVPWRERRVHVNRLVSRSGLISSAQDHQSVRAEHESRTDAGDPELTESHPVTRRDENDNTAFDDCGGSVISLWRTTGVQMTPFGTPRACTTI